MQRQGNIQFIVTDARMKWNILLYYVLFTIILGNDEVDSYKLGTENDLSILEPGDVKNCTKMKFYCESCTNLVMCVDSDYGFMKQHVTCPAGSSCLVDKCTRDRNPLCDGTANIPFNCHVTGTFPDPFDCQKYHFCVPRSNTILNGAMNLSHFEHKCPNDGDIEYGYDPMTTYCTHVLDKGCPKFPVPLCRYEGETGALKENQSIFYVCDLVDGHLYPHMYVCPHGELYNPTESKCQRHIPTTLPPPPFLPQPFSNDYIIG